VTPLEKTITNSADCRNKTNAHEATNNNKELLTTSKTLRFRRIMRWKFLTHGNIHAEETFRHCTTLDTSDEDVEQLILDSSKSDLSLRRALVIVVVIDADFTVALVASKVNLNLGGKVSLSTASRDGDPVVITNKLVPVTLTSKVAARSIGHITISGKTIIVVWEVADANGSVALGVDHRVLLVDLEGENTSIAGEASHEEEVVSTRS